MRREDSSLRPTDYESRRKSSIEPNLARESESSPGSSAEFSGVGDQFRDQVFGGQNHDIPRCRFHAEAEVKTGLCAPLRSATRKRFGCKCVRFGIPFSRNPRNPDVGKLLEQGARFRVQGSDVLLANLRAAVYLVDDELRVKEHPDALDSTTAGEL